MIKRLSILLILLMALISVSCDNGGASSAIQTSGSKVVGVTMKLQLQGSQDKVLSITSGTADINNIAYYEYRATPKWTSVDWGSVQGVASVWTVLAQDETLWFTQGLWLIEARAYSAGGTILCEGQITCYISQSISSIEIPIKRLSGSGQIDINITVPELSPTGGNLTLDYRTFAGQTVVFSNFTATRDNHIITYTATIPVDAGSYVLNFMFGDSNVDFIYGETYVAEVFANMTTSVSGDLALGTLVRAGKSVESNADKDETVSFVCLSEADEYHWYVNGTKMQSGDRHFFVFTPTDYNTYTVECRLNDSSASADVGTVVLYVRKAITITLHFENNSVLTVNTYSGVMTKSDLSHYLTSMYEQNWYTAAENGTGGGGSKYNSNAAFTNDIDLYAHRNYYTVTFNKNNNSSYVSVSPGTIKGYHGTALGSLPSISITSNSFTNIFDGWYTTSNSANGVQIDETVLITGNVTYYAKWTTGSIGTTQTGKYNVVFAVYDHSEVPGYFHWNTRNSIIRVNTNSKISENDVPTIRNLVMPDGYSQVDGWYRSRTYDAEDNALLSNKWDFDNDRVTGHMMLYANPVKDSDKRTISFNTHGGTNINTMTVYRLATADAPAKPTRPGYNFAGWFKDADFKEPWNFATDYVYDNMTLHALWLQNAHDYLENTSSTDGAYINTGIIPDDNTKVVIAFDYEGDHDVTIAGTGDPAWGIKVFHVRKTFGGVYGNEEVRATGIDYTTSRIKWNVEFSQVGGFLVNGELYSLYGHMESSGTTFTEPICIFKAPSDSTYAIGKCYSVQIYQGAKIVRNLVPYLRADDNVAGFYDTVSGGFFTSASSTQFTAGDD
ncbi:MAG: InlB B-repeat-containing protein [Spirochaetia bacterium]|nr:InlB B-repeat-containing protein [Spirochaetia bacterium]